MKFLNVRHPFLRPLWRRIALVGFMAGWTGLELWHQNFAWAFLFGALGVFLLWELFIAFDPANYEEEKAEKEKPRE